MVPRRRIQSGFCIAVAVLAFAAPAWCQILTLGEERSESPYVFETFTTADGLPHDAVRAIHIEHHRNGSRVWVGTEGGLAVLDAGRWTSWKHLDRQKQKPLPTISAIDVDAATSDVWLGTWSKGLIRLSGGRFDRFDQFNGGLAGNVVLAMAVTQGRVWAATNGGISSFDPITGTWGLLMERRADAPEQTVTSLDVGPAGASLYAGRWCVGVTDAVLRIDLPHGEISAVAGPRGDASDNPGPCDAEPGSTLVAVDPSGQTLWWTRQGDLFRRDALGPSEVRRIDGPGLSGHTICALTARSDTEIWLGTERGLFVLTDWTTGTWATHIPGSRVWCIAFEGDDVWIGTASGLLRTARSARRDEASRTTTKSNVPVARKDRASRRTDRPESAIQLSKTVSSKTESSKTESSKTIPSPRTPRRYGTHLMDENTVAIGVLSPATKTIFVPGHGSHPEARRRTVDPSAVQMAITQANERGGYRGEVPFEIAIDEGAYVPYGWHLPEDILVGLSQQSNVWGIVGRVDPGDNFARATALRTEVPVANTATYTAPLTSAACAHPWIIGYPPDAAGRRNSLIDYIIDELDMTRLAVLRTPGPTARVHLSAWARYARDRNRPLVADIPYDPDEDDITAVLSAIRRSRADVVLTWCELDVAVSILRSMREAGMSQLFVGSEQIVMHRFADLIGRDPGPVIAPTVSSNSGDEDEAARFNRNYEAVFRQKPKPYAHRNYQAARLLLQAIDIAGLNRPAVARTLRDMHTATIADLQDSRWRFLHTTVR